MIYTFTLIEIVSLTETTEGTEIIFSILFFGEGPKNKTIEPFGECVFPPTSHCRKAEVVPFKGVEVPLATMYRKYILSIGFLQRKLL